MVSTSNKKIRILIITQKVDKNDAILGFFHGWLLEFAKHYEFITVIALQVGEYELPKNVKVLSLGKEKSVSKIKYIFNFYKYIWQQRKDYDAVFVHMNHGYVLIGGIFWKIWRKKISLWYAHGHTSLFLRIAEKFSDIILTSTASGFRLKSKKVYIIGQGIDVEKFKPADNICKDDVFRIISVGRISPIKDYETLINAVDILVKDKIQVTIKIIGGAGLLAQEEYFSKLKHMVKERNLESAISFIGAISNKDIVKYLQNSDMFVNTSRTGSLDKAVLEAMAVGLPVLTCNEALNGILGDLNDSLMFVKGDSMELSEKIRFIANMKNSDRINLGQNLRKIIKEKHNLIDFVDKISSIIK